MRAVEVIASPSAVQLLRAETRADHEAVDAAFSRLPLDTRAGYGVFLTAHARILPLAERLIDPGDLLAHWQGRTQPLATDLETLGLAMPPEMSFTLPEGEAARWGALYVLEGSRLGGAYLLRRVPEDLPTAFLGAAHPTGAWRSLLDALDRADEGSCWRDEALQGAKALFAAYGAAANTHFPPSPRT